MIQKQPFAKLYKIGFLQNFGNFRKAPTPEPIFMKYLFDEVSLLKKRQIFSCKFCEVFKYTFFIKHLQATASDSESQVVCLDITT